MDRKLLINGRFFAQPLSGVQRFATELTEALRNHHSGSVIVLGPPASRLGASYVDVVGRGGGQIWEQLELPRHVSGGMLINFGNTAPLSLSSQIVVIHDAGVFATPEAYSMKFRIWYKLVHWRLVRGGARIVTVSEFSRRELVRYLGAKPDRIAVISEGADHMDAIAADPGVLDRIPGGRFVLAVGNLAAHKNLRALGELAIRLAARGETLVVAGGLAKGAFRKKTEAALPQPACYIGRVSDGELKSLYQNAACLVFPSRYEGFGLPAVEAMACGCPVVVSRIPALEETCGDAAIYVDPSSPADIAEQVCRLLDDAVLDSRMRNRARSRAASFTWKRAAAQIAEIAQHVHTKSAATV